MSDKIRKSFRYASPIDCLIDTEIREYDISKANISVTSGWWYCVRGVHSVTEGSTTETTSTHTASLKAS